MNILINQHSDMPIYEQIKRQMKQMIIKDELNEHDKLPSVRTLSKELQIGIITVKRAYDDLVKEGLILSIQGKGYYVSKIDKLKIQDSYLEEIKSLMHKINILKKEANIKDTKLKDLWEKERGK